LPLSLLLSLLWTTRDLQSIIDDGPNLIQSRLPLSQSLLEKDPFGLAERPGIYGLYAERLGGLSETSLEEIRSDGWE
jgi:hypothetical protein